MSLWIAALTSFARNDKLLCTFSLRHCEGVRRTTEAIQSTRVACLFGLPRSLRSAPPKSAVLDYWQLEVLPLVLFCIRKNSLVSNFYAGRAGCLSGTRRTCQNPPLGFPYRSLLSWTSLRCRPLRTRSPGFASLTRPEIRFFDFGVPSGCIPFRNSSNFSIPSPDSTWGVHFVQPRQNPPLEFPYRSALPLVWLRQYSLRASLPGFHPSGNPQKKDRNTV